ncbi:heterocyst development glycosyltransferase HepC [Calothrix sp. UHCC 0171]|uniref:heterocyst development glycosyltransferase HepC n=1 Tax=Calothrix sp. UHCC 0171 TaxID=3110245 RepID=UPI002B1F77EE|nr:heterocyst development glycosyltransferase HepC [Calothrix sp. UHCC 0171]MEA5573375.1 heterocyst development glycosyltransferase HepC [Calothrix sp. UHCC 0171]
MHYLFLYDSLVAKCQYSRLIDDGCDSGCDLSQEDNLTVKANTENDSWDYHITNPQSCKQDGNLSELKSNFGYKVKQKNRFLLVRRIRNTDKAHLLAERNEQFLAGWLQFCSAAVVILDPELNKHHIQTWADICQRYGKAVFLQIPRYNQRVNYPIACLLKRVFDWIIAVILLFVVSPILLGLLLLKPLSFSEEFTLTNKWCVGERGRLFRLHEFRHLTSNQIYLNSCLNKCLQNQSLSKLPKLLNVLKGQMSLVGREPVSLVEALEIESIQRSYLNCIPGIMSWWK